MKGKGGVIVQDEYAGGSMEVDRRHCRFKSMAAAVACLGNNNGAVPASGVPALTITVSIRE